ncbi:hypothetical protein M427DRAFT_70128 [Gonapodya prolifera JEL478]|uniref:Uncharacterized protein n=1 Tax=Gonapodya prolifera (strain JEL478) TaxID=1344416 RepID=A0A139AFT9_GONPJ|nr:hypothetical protein M427DRAFT_70128 [Gonapodya prolifera JEL478]|eukprot:KXS15285.1 hypothetical protein M427DRAFT_70128 [Gonapodya prolifera JEL478]
MAIEKLEADWANQWRGTWTSTKECEDWAVIEKVLTYQGISWMIRKVGLAITPQDGLDIVVENGVPALQVARLSLPKVLGQPVYRFPLNGSEIQYDDAPFGKLKASLKRVDGPGNVIHHDVAAVDGSWTAAHDWSIEEENGEHFHHRRTVFKTGKEVLNIHQKYKKTV